MKTSYGKEYPSNPQGTSCDICIDAVATSDDGQIIILTRTLSYGVNTANIGWREQAVSALKEKKS